MRQTRPIFFLRTVMRTEFVECDCQSGPVCFTIASMTTVEEIEHAVTELAPSELSRLAAWMREYDAKVWDGQMEEDSASSRLDFLFEEAESERKAGKLRDWPSAHGKT